MKRLALVCGAFLSIALVGCGSSVSLTKPTVEDRSTRSSGAAQAGAGNAASSGSASTVTSGTVKSIQLPGSDANSVVPGQVRVIYFDYDSYAVLPAYQPVVEANARYLLANPARKATLEGHTDERGGREYNLALGQKRAEAVRKAMLLVGAKDSQLEAVSYGKEKPAVVGSSEEAMQKNRRVEISVQ